MTPTIKPPEYAESPYRYLLVEASEKYQRKRFLLGFPTTGLVRVEVMAAKQGQYIPCNWSMSERMHPLSNNPILTVAPLGYDVKDARNIIVQHAVEQEFDWLFFLDSDVILPPDTFIKLAEYMREDTLPVVGGLYFTKSYPAEPLIYRGRGNSYYSKWKLGERVWCDAIGMGCTLISVQVLRAMWKDAPEYVAGGRDKVRMVYDTPAFQWVDPETKSFKNFSGTEDISWFDRMIQGNYLSKAGYKDVARRKYPVLCDTSIMCYHITPDGIRYPIDLRW
jgi:Glycosyl transferase family 2